MVSFFQPVYNSIIFILLCPYSLSLCSFTDNVFKCDVVALFTNQYPCIFPEPQSAMNAYEISYKFDFVSVKLQTNVVHLMKLYPPCIWMPVLYVASQLSRVIMVSNVIVVYTMFIGIVQIWTKTSTQTDNPLHLAGHVLHVMNSIFPSIIYWMIMHSYLHYLQMT